MINNFFVSDYYIDFNDSEISGIKDDKIDIWCLGHILYEIIYQKKYKEYENNFSISSIYSDYDSEYKQILSKLLCKRKKRLDFKNLIGDRILRKKSVEINIFDKLIQKDDIKGK